MHKETASIALDLSGDGLHLRAIAIVLVLRRSKKPWQPLLCAIRLAARNTAARSDVWFRYVLIEAAMLATDRAPGLHRGRGALAAGRSMMKLSGRK